LPLYARADCDDGAGTAPNERPAFFPMLPGDREKALLEAYFEVLRDGRVERLDALLAKDYQDHNPVPGQFPGLAGIKLKVLFFRAHHPGARIVIESIEAVSPGARAVWRTTAPGLGGEPAESTWRFVGEFEFADGKIKSSRVDAGERV